MPYPLDQVVHRFPIVLDQPFFRFAARHLVEDIQHTTGDSGVVLVRMPTPEQERIESLTESIAQLLHRQDELERRIIQLEGTRPATARRPPSPVPLPVDVLPPVPPPSPSHLASEVTPERVTLETKVGLTLINRIGVITLVLGVAFFFKWAADNNWVGPAGRVLLGALLGLATLAAGDMLWRKGQRAFAQGIAGAGIAVLYLAFYSAYGFYHLIPQSAGFPLMCCVTASAFVLSLRYDSPAVTGLGMLGGYLTPILLSTGQPHPWFLFSYVFLLDAVAMALAKKRIWKSLELVAAFATVIIYVAWLSELPENTNRLPAAVALLAFVALFSQAFEPLVFVFWEILAALAVVKIGHHHPLVFFALALLLAVAGFLYAERKPFPKMLLSAFGGFWLSYALYAVSSGEAAVLPPFLGVTAAFLLFLLPAFWSLARNHGEPNPQRLSILPMNGIVYYAAAYWLLEPAHHRYVGPLATAVSAAYLGFGAVLLRKGYASGENRAPQMAFGMALVFATLAVPIQFTGFTITLAWSIEAAALTWLAARFRIQRYVLLAGLIFALVAVRLLSFDAWLLPHARTYSLLWNQRFVTFAVAGLSLLLASRWIAPLFRALAIWEYAAGHLVLLYGLSLEVMALVERSMPGENALSAETVSLSILYGIYALALVSAGVATRTAINRIAGLILIGFIIAKLYLFDVWQLQRPYRISAFIALGILLISTSFLYSRFRPLIESLLRDQRDDELLR